MKILTSWDDGHPLDFKVAELLKRYDMPGIFFIPTNCEISERDIKALAEDFDIGGHTTTHPHDMKRLSYEEQLSEIEGNKAWLESVINREVDWFCYPRGRYNEDTIDILHTVGYKKARTTWVNNYLPCDNVYRIHPTIHVLNGRKEYATVSWLGQAIQQLELAKSVENSYYHLWGHSWEIDRYNLWHELEQFLEILCKLK